MERYLKIIVVIILSTAMSCSSTNDSVAPAQNSKKINYLALGDSYTIGQSVCETCKFPVQLSDTIKKYLNTNDKINTTIIAQTGWTTTNLKSAITTQNPATNFDLVTLLIGVNNQYENKPFTLYQQEFPELVAIAIEKAKGKKENVIVVSIPDYAFTPAGNGNTTISSQIDSYNAFAQNYCTQNEISFVNITDITRLGLEQPNLVATDGLHPSELAYKKFVERIFPIAKDRLGL